MTAWLKRWIVERRADGDRRKRNQRRYPDRRHWTRRKDDRVGDGGRL